MFFTEEQKNLALKMKKGELKREYKKSEEDLKQVALTGDETNLSKAMKKHGRFEYAMLYQKTPEFKERRKRK